MNNEIKTEQDQLVKEMKSRQDEMKKDIDIIEKKLLDMKKKIVIMEENFSKVHEIKENFLIVEDKINNIN